MRGLIALVCAGWLTACATPPTTQPNTVPLEFGMTPAAAQAALGIPLTRVAGRTGADIYFAAATAGTPGFYRVDAPVYLQFRKGKLTGWKHDWHIPPAW